VSDATIPSLGVSGSQSALHLRTVNELARALLPPTAMEDILWVVARTAISRLGFDDCVIYLLDDERSTLVQKAAYGPKNPTAKVILDPIEIPVGEGIVGSVAASGRSVLVGDTRQDSRYILDDEMRLSELAVPIVHEGSVIGVIDSEHPDADFYSQAHHDILTTIASMASTKIASALTIERLNETVERLGETERARRDGERRYRVLYEQHPSMFFTLDLSGVVVSANEFALAQLGHERSSLVGRRFETFSPPDHADIVSEGIGRCIAEPGKVHRWESCRLRDDGSQIWVRDTAHVVELESNIGPSVLVVSEDITDTYKLARDLEYQASHDALTGLFNRREFERRVSEALADAQRNGTSHALCYMDLDQFKVINDTAGHVAGDQLLRQLGDAFRDRVRKSDVVARLGGDEFGVLLRNANVEQATALANALLEVVGASRFHWDGQLFRYGVSIGVVPIVGGESDLPGVLASADAACYAAKEGGRHRVHVYSQDDEELRNRHAEMGWAVRLNEAIEHERFELYYQPIFPCSSGSGEPKMLEILLRMADGEGNVIAANSFLPAAERYGISTELDRLVIKQTMRWLACNPKAASSIDLCNINISGTSLGNSDFASFVLSEIETAGVSASTLCFEITETAAVANLYNAQNFIRTLKGIGCRFALDDFGSGLSSFAYLKNLEVDFLKINGTFVRDIATEHVDREMVRAISGIATMMGKRTVAQFVESEDTLKLLRQLGVEFAQGFHLGHPRPLDELAVLAVLAEPQSLLTSYCNPPISSRTDKWN
jgi:diguanylate cyclase (GGDEF)-like protein/PAS domain S-box-containing protein